jgi:hypothetical protein
MILLTHCSRGYLTIPAIFIAARRTTSVKLTLRLVLFSQTRIILPRSSGMCFLYRHCEHVDVVAQFSDGSDTCQAVASIRVRQNDPERDIV